jgi:predicted nucleotidyltransferase component of viral defense system
MDLDASGVKKDALLDAVMRILESRSFQDTLKPFGIAKVVPPNVAKAKQTETTQRFKVHLITHANEDLFTKIEFSRRGFKGKAKVKPVSDSVLRKYKLPPLLIPHYNIHSTILQKIAALAGRTVTQARDIFDLYVLSSQCEGVKMEEEKISRAVLDKAHERIFEITFDRFQDTVISYLSADDQETYNHRDAWDEVKLKTANFVEGMRESHG